jgi:hypothetical protein
LGDVGRNVFRPACGGIKTDDANRVLVLSNEQVGDDSFQIGLLGIGPWPDAAIAAQIVSTL